MKDRKQLAGFQLTAKKYCLCQQLLHHYQVEDKKLNSHAYIFSEGRERSSDISQIFWQHWQQYRDDLYRCCIQWMGNPTDAEDALSRAMLKAWQKVQKYAAREITNFKAWLTLTRNLCVDIYR